MVPIILHHGGTIIMSIVLTAIIGQHVPHAAIFIGVGMILTMVCVFNLIDALKEKEAGD